MFVGSVQRGKAIGLSSTHFFSYTAVSKSTPKSPGFRDIRQDAALGGGLVLHLRLLLHINDNSPCTEY